ncbi:MAG: cation:proton antiporter [Rhodospirillales bacterium]|nr:cation:proton antiporter [Rhodospirillales bacterium]
MGPLEYLAIIWCGVFVAILAARKTKLTPVLYYLAVGAILVNTGVLPEKSPDFIHGFAEVGIVLIMFALGFEESTSNFLKSIKRSWGIAFFGAVAPFVTAYLIADYYWRDTNVALMCGLAMTATAVSLTMVSLKAEGLQKSAAATGIMTSAVLDDIASLALVAILVPVAIGDSTLAVSDIAWVLGKALIFFAIVTFLGAWIFPHESIGMLARIPIIRRFGIKNLLGFAEGEQATLVVLTIAVLVGILAHVFGFHPAVGAYMAGLVIKEEYFHLLGDPGVNHYDDTKKIVDSVAFSWIGPVFFVELGTKIVFHWDILVSVIPQTIVLTSCLLIAQISSAGLAARYTGRFNFHESLMIGFGMLGRAELAFVVIDIAYVQNSILNEEAFYTLMFTAFWLNVAVPITIAWWKPYYVRRNTGP